MGIAILDQVFEEVRRLAIAGSVVSKDDFRLKKLIPALEQAGGKAPVLSKVAEAIKKVVAAEEQDSAEALLELTTLVTAILYTQGKTGASGDLEPIETTDLGIVLGTQTPARVLKPLIEALTTTGSGRLELIKEAHAKGLFNDLRLVRPSLEAMDDPHGEVANFVATKVLPIYGKGLIPWLKSSLDVNGHGGHGRRLRLLHSLDPVGSREFVRKALDCGSKETRIAAIECLGIDPDDLPLLLEQASAKAQEVRMAAYRALSLMDREEAVNVIKKALAGKDLDLVSGYVQAQHNPEILEFVLSEAKRAIDNLTRLGKGGTPQEASEVLGRAQGFLHCLEGRQDPAAEEFMIQVFDQRNSLSKVKGSLGDSLLDRIITNMRLGSSRLQSILGEAHATLAGMSFAWSFHAARQSLPPERVFDMFSPYFKEETRAKKSHREALIEAIGGTFFYMFQRPETGSFGLDPRWLDVAIEAKHLGLIRLLARPGHATLETFLKESFDTVLPKSKALSNCYELVATMVTVKHPAAIGAFVATLERFGKKPDYGMLGFTRLAIDLPREALPLLEDLVTKLDEKVADTLLGHIQELRDETVNPLQDQGREC